MVTQKNLNYLGIVVIAVGILVIGAMLSTLYETGTLSVSGDVRTWSVNDVSVVLEIDEREDGRVNASRDAYCNTSGESDGWTFYGGYEPAEFITRFYIEDVKLIGDMLFFKMDGTWYQRSNSCS